MLLGITGRLKCGKDTLADFIVSAMSDDDAAATFRTSYAKALRDVSEAAFGSRYETQESKEQVDAFWHSRVFFDPPRTPAARSEWPMLGDEPVTGRRILQFAGTEMFRNLVHRDFWVMVLGSRWEAAKAAGKRHLIVTDVRFDNEAQVIREQGGIVLRLRRGGIVDGPVVHASEAGVNDGLVDADLTCSSLDELLGLAHLLGAYAAGAGAALDVARVSFGSDRDMSKPACIRVPVNHTISGNVSLVGSVGQGDDAVCADSDAVAEDLEMLARVRREPTRQTFNIDVNPEGPQG